MRGDEWRLRARARVEARVEVRVGSDARMLHCGLIYINKYIYITCGRMLPPRLRRPATSLPRSHPSCDIHRHTSHCRCHRRRSCHQTRRPSSDASRGGTARPGHQGRDRPGRGGLGRSAVLAWLGSGAGLGLGLELGSGSESGSGSRSGSGREDGEGCAARLPQPSQPCPRRGVDHIARTAAYQLRHALAVVPAAAVHPIHDQSLPLPPPLQPPRHSPPRPFCLAAARRQHRKQRRHLARPDRRRAALDRQPQAIQLVVHAAASRLPEGLGTAGRRRVHPWPVRALQAREAAHCILGGILAGPCQRPGGSAR
jgi:hypothetical protein